MRRAYANPLKAQVGVAQSVVHAFKPCINAWGGEVQHHSCRLVYFEGCEGGEVKESCEPLEFSNGFLKTPFVAGQWHMMWSSSPSTLVLVARQCGHNLSGNPLEDL